MLKILQASLQQYMTWELSHVQVEFRKGSRTSNQIANIRWIIGKVRECQKFMYYCFIDYNKTFECMDYYKLWKILKELRRTDYHTCLLRNLLQLKKQQLESYLEQMTGS